MALAEITEIRNDLGNLFHLKRRIKHDQFGARGHEVVTAVRLHKPGVYIVLRV